MGSIPALEKQLSVIDREIMASGEAEDWKRWNELQKQKKDLRIALTRMVDAKRKGTHEQQDHEQQEAAESEAS